MESESPEADASAFDERSPSRILADLEAAQHARTHAPKLLAGFSALALLGVAGFAISLLLAVTSPHGSSAAIYLMLVSTAAILIAMVLASIVSALPSRKGGRRVS